MNIKEFFKPNKLKFIITLAILFIPILYLLIPYFEGYNIIYYYNFNRLILFFIFAIFPIYILSCLIFFFLRRNSSINSFNKLNLKNIILIIFGFILVFTYLVFTYFAKGIEDFSILMFVLLFDFFLWQHIKKDELKIPIYIIIISFVLPFILILRNIIPATLISIVDSFTFYFLISGILFIFIPKNKSDYLIKKEILLIIPGIFLISRAYGAEKDLIVNFSTYTIAFPEIMYIRFMLFLFIIFLVFGFLFIFFAYKIYKKNRSAFIQNPINK